MPGHQLWKYKQGPCLFHSGEWGVRLHSPGIFKGLHILKVFFLKSLETNAQNGTLHIDYERHSSSSTMNCALIVRKVYLPGIISKSGLAHTVRSREVFNKEGCFLWPSRHWAILDQILEIIWPWGLLGLDLLPPCYVHLLELYGFHPLALWSVQSVILYQMSQDHGPGPNGLILL